MQRIFFANDQSCCPGFQLQRYAHVVRLVPEKTEEYLALHRAVWPLVLEQIHRSNIRNYSLYLHEGLVFSYYEYVGNNHEKDMAAMAADKTTQHWWTFTSPCQQPVDSAPPGQLWKEIEEVFHAD